MKIIIALAFIGALWAEPTPHASLYPLASADRMYRVPEIYGYCRVVLRHVASLDSNCFVFGRDIPLLPKFKRLQEAEAASLGMFIWSYDIDYMLPDGFSITSEETAWLAHRAYENQRGITPTTASSRPEPGHMKAVQNAPERATYEHI